MIHFNLNVLYQWRFHVFLHCLKTHFMSALLCFALNMCLPNTQPASRQDWAWGQRMTPGRAPSTQCITQLHYLTVHYTSGETFKAIWPLPGVIKVMFNQFFLCHGFQKNFFSRVSRSSFMLVFIVYDCAIYLLLKTDKLNLVKTVF